MIETVLARKDPIIDDQHRSCNYNSRVLFLVLHYTAVPLEKSLELLTDPYAEHPVSAHYLIPDAPIDQQRKIFRLVDEKERAWHAGVSSWEDKTDLNDTSIGIEIVNLGYKLEDGKRVWYPFDDDQIEQVISLSQGIVECYNILPTRVVAHSDIAPDRKDDPGPLFPWKKLHEQGVGAWFNEDALSLSQDPIDIQKLQRKLSTYGYKIEETGQLDTRTKQVITAFQMHFRPANYSGQPDAETVAILDNLIERYFPESIRSKSDDTLSASDSNTKSDPNIEALSAFMSD